MLIQFNSDGWGAGIYTGIRYSNEKLNSINVFKTDKECDPKLLYKDSINRIYQKTEEQRKVYDDSLLVKEAVKENIFTQMSIREAMKALEVEYVLDNILSSNTDFKKQWDEAKFIDLKYSSTVEAIKDISEEMINQIKIKIYEMNIGA